MAKLKFIKHLGFVLIAAGLLFASCTSHEEAGVEQAAGTTDSTNIPPSSAESKPAPTSTFSLATPTDSLSPSSTVASPPSTEVTPTASPSDSGVPTPSASTPPAPSTLVSPPPSTIVSPSITPPPPFTSTPIPPSQTPAGTLSPATIGVSAPSTVTAGSSFDVTLNIGDIIDLSAFDFCIAYNSSVFRIDSEEGGPGVSPGLINSVQIPIDVWAFNPPGIQGKIGAVTRVAKPISGHGYLAVIHFKVIGSAGQSSSIAFSSFGSVNKVDLFNATDQNAIPHSFAVEQTRVGIE